MNKTLEKILWAFECMAMGVVIGGGGWTIIWKVLYDLVGFNVSDAVFYLVFGCAAAFFSPLYSDWSRQHSVKIY